ncbi:MAG TPA: signal peptidase I [Thermoanaerobaculia bacterium]|jgi:signal peptidase I
MAAAAESDRKSTAREYYEALLIAIIFVNFARIFVFQAFKIPTPSMEDNLKVGDHLIVNKFIYGPKSDGLLSKLVPLRDVRRGDIIVFRYPENPEVDYVKRVVGLPGDVIAIKDKKVSVNGQPLHEPYVLYADPQVYPGGDLLPDPWRSRDQYGPKVVPPGQYFAMGDNRDHSSDSRFWGGVPRGYIKGRAFMVYWSYEGDPPAPGASVRTRLRELVHVARTFVTQTRWHRTFYIIDSKYHYTPGFTTHGNE